jgi:plasmid stability protein
MHGGDVRNLTIRNVPDELAEALEREKGRRSGSLNQTVIELLSQGLGVAGPRSNGLARLAGTWTEEEYREFEKNVAPFEEIDPELWR